MFIERKIFSISKKVFSFSHRAFLRSEEYIPKETKEEMGRKVISISEKIVSKTSSFLSSLKQKIFSKEAVPLSEKLIENNLEKTVSIPLVDGISKGDLTEISIGDFLNHKLQNEFLPKITDKINFLNLNIFNLNLKEKKVLDYILQNKKEILPFVISSPFVQFSSVFGSVVWVSFDLFSKEIIQSQELDKIKLKNKTQTQFKTLQKNNISNNIDNKNIIYQQNKKEEANLLKNTPRPKNEEKKKEDIFFLECSLCFFNTKIGDKIVVTKNIPSKGLKMGSIGLIEKISIPNKAIVKFYKKPNFTKNWTIQKLKNSHPLFLPEKQIYY